MIYFDTGDAGSSPMNTGIQRVVRGIYRGLMTAGLPVTPLVWNDSLESYCALSKAELGFLENPFADSEGKKALARPSRSAQAIPLWSKFQQQRIHRQNRFDLAAQAKATDVLLVPSVFKERQRVWLRESSERIPVRKVAIFHDAIAWRRPDITPSSNAKGFFEYMMALENFDAIVTPSQESADDLKACWKENKTPRSTLPPITVIGWPVDEKFSKSPPAIQPSSEPKKILSVGTFEPRKNHLKLLAAAEQLWREGLKFELILVGRTTKFGKIVETEIKRLQRAGYAVEWRRHVNDELLLTAYDECAFTVFPTLIEGFGLPIAESLQRGRPCICGANGALGELANGGGCLTVDQTNAEAMAKVIKQLLTDENLYEHLCVEAQSRKFETWPEYMKKLLPMLAK